MGEAWNGQRLLILDEAISQRLLPSLKQGLESKLKQAAKQAVVHGAARKFRTKYLAKGPFQPKDMTQPERLSRPKAGLRVVACAVSEDRNFGDVLVALTEQVRSCSVCGGSGVFEGPKGRPALLATSSSGFVKSYRTKSYWAHIDHPAPCIAHIPLWPDIPPYFCVSYFLAPPPTPPPRIPAW